MLHLFGYGDDGGPIRKMVELTRRLPYLEGAPRSHYGDVRSFFAYVEYQCGENRLVGELYLAWHRGTYTVQRCQKALVRQAEHALHDAEATLMHVSPCRCEMTVRRHFGASESEQIIRMRATTQRVSFVTRVGWRERHCMLKVQFSRVSFRLMPVHPHACGAGTSKKQAIP